MVIMSLFTWMGWSTLQPIGHISSIFSQKFGTPRQGSVVPDSVASLKVSETKGMHSRQCLEGIEDYSHVWLLWAAHLNGHDAARAKVQAPKLRGRRAGLFSTRTPFRPNPIGLTLARLDEVIGDTLHLSGIDLVDGTPILDIKPYIPQYDSPQNGEAVRVAPWVDAPPLEDVRFTEDAANDLKSVMSASSGLISDRKQFRKALVQCLAADPRPHYRWRRERQAGCEDRDYEIKVDGINVKCRFERNEDATAEWVTVLSLALASC